jgi:hypothetical protein
MIIQNKKVSFIKNKFRLLRKISNISKTDKKLQIFIVLGILGIYTSII